jgi:hypothetical protein
MAQETPPAGRLVMTEGEPAPPPGPTVPEPPGTPPGGPAVHSHLADEKGEGDYDALLEVKRLAERVGGLDRLREMVDVLSRLQR